MKNSHISLFRVWFCLMGCFGTFSLSAQTVAPTEISAQYGPETGISGLMPKLSYRGPAEGWYGGVSVSVWLVAVGAVTVAPCYGYRYRGAASELSVAFTWVGARRDGGRGQAGFFINANPRVMLGHRMYVGFGPGFYLYRSKRPTNTLWDDVGRYNFELGYSERLRW